MNIVIVAHDQNGLIGKGDGLPWQLPEDLKLFKKYTAGHAVVMGRKTWESLPEQYRPLPHRVNIILSRSMKQNLRDDSLAFVLRKWEQVEGIVREISPEMNVFVIGGASVYDYVLNKSEIKVDRILLSLVDGEHEGDIYFPQLEGLWADAHVSSHEGFNLIEKIRYETCIPLDNR
tara:strand:+ start:17836 stop:18360 length:525 start_codon:yes stop_codon:yes gene_type:complete